MTKVRFHQPEEIVDESLRFAVIVSRYHEKWLYCKHRRRNTVEIPGGHREPGETIRETARRELYEETGALDYTLRQIGIYSVQRDEEETSFGALFLAEISTLGPLPECEMERIVLYAEAPDCQTYPEIQPYLQEKAVEFLRETERLPK